MIVKPVLILGYGNPSRGDDALAPMLLEKIQVFPSVLLNHVELLTDFQLQIEHALDLKQRQLVLFIDASMANQHTVELRQLEPHADNSYSTHAMSPQAIMQVYQNIENQELPPCFLLSLKGESFELGESLTSQAQQSLNQAIELLRKLLQQSQLEFWQRLCC